MPRCEHTKSHPARKTEERVAEFVLGLIRNPDILREKVEEQAEAECKRLKSANREAERLRGLLTELDRKRERLMDLALDGSFGREEIAHRAAALDEERAAVERELGEIGEQGERLRELEALPGLVEDYLRDLPDLVGWKRPVREYETVGAKRTPENPLGAYILTPENIRHKSGEEVEAERQRSEDERSARLREIYTALGLTVTAYKDGTLICRWSFGERSLPGVNAPERSL